MLRLKGVIFMARERNMMKGERSKKGRQGTKKQQEKKGKNEGMMDMDKDKSGGGMFGY